jgi:hypothetical protein
LAIASVDCFALLAMSFGSFRDQLGWQPQR